MMGTTFWLCLRAFAGSLTAALVLTPWARRMAVSLNIFDHPDGKLKQHAAPVPYLGGIAVFAAFALNMALLADWTPALQALLLGGGAMAALGLCDDLYPRPWWQKLLAQCAICLCADWAGLHIQHDSIHAFAAHTISVLWLVAATNALNMVDVADGLASCVSLTAATALAVLTGLLSSGVAALAALMLAGACLGFLPYNRAPAKLYLGDAGSLFIGFTLSGLALLADYTDHPPLSLLAPVGILGVPFLDTMLVAMARLARRRSPFQGSGDHFALRLRSRGWSANAVAAAGTATGTCFAVIAISLAILPGRPALAALSLGAAVFASLFAWLWQLGGDRTPAAQ